MTCLLLSLPFEFILLTYFLFSEDEVQEYYLIGHHFLLAAFGSSATIAIHVVKMNICNCLSHLTSIKLLSTNFGLVHLYVFQASADPLLISPMCFFQAKQDP